MKTVYLVDSFGCTFSSREKFTQQLQDMIDFHADQGWKLHSFETPGSSASLCVVVFYREVEDTEA